MYYLTIWDTRLAASGKEACLFKLKISTDLAKILFNSDPDVFPILSSLSFDDYDLFSDLQLESLTHELRGIATIHSSAIDLINAMVQVIQEAKQLGKSILFDPFCNE